MPVDVLVLPSSSMNTKWKEPYASASLNAKLVGVVPAGIYRGLLLQPDPALGDRTVLVQADPIKLDHVAIYENANGYSVTYRDDTSGDITLSLTAFASVTVIICVFVDYQSGVTTTGAFRIYTLAEYNGLSATIRNALVVLGTVIVPASGTIASGNISSLRRTLASANLQNGMVASSPVVRNPSFEIGATNATYPKSSLFWDKSVTVGTGAWKTSTAVVSSGVKSIELSVTAGSVTGDMSQQVGIETAAGEQFFASVSIKQLKTISSGTLQFFMEWSDVNDDILSTTTASLDGGGVDSAFRVVPVAAVAPAGAVSLRTIGIRATALSPLTFGVFAYIDNVDVTVVPRNPKYPYPLDQAFRRNEATSGLVVEDKTGNFAALAGLLGFDLSTPASEGRATFERRDQDYTGGNLPPAMALFGRLFQLGSKLLGSEANALKPRVSADYSAVGGVDFTLMWESARNGETTGGYTQPAVRIYASNDGQFVFTSNAVWGGTTWTKDVSADNATKFSMANDGIRVLTRVSSTAWSDSAWADTLRMTNPLETNVDARTPRLSASLFDGAVSDLTLIAQFSYAGHKIRFYTTDSGTSVSLQFVVNAAWDGTNWNKDTAGHASTRWILGFLATGSAIPQTTAIRCDIRNASTASFSEAGWSEVGASSGAFFRAGIVQAGVMNANSADNTQAILSSAADFGGTIGSGSELMDTRNLLDTSNLVIDSLGLLTPRGAHIFQEFATTGLPQNWVSVVSGTGANTFNVDGLTRATMTSGTGSAGIRTDPTVVAGAYSSFSAVMRWDNVTGSSFVGLVDGSNVLDFGFVQDSGTYGDEKFRIVCRTGSGLQVHDTGIVPADSTHWVLLKAYCAGGTGIIGTSRVYWHVQQLAAFFGLSASGVFNPGAGIVNPTVGRAFMMNAAGGGIVSVDRCCIGGQGNLSF